MAHRYSRVEKGKWTVSETRSERRRPVQIPNRDNSALIEENKLTLIGRVTNPTVQKTQWVVEWFLQFWNVEGLTGRELGPDLFQIRFPSEETLQSVLKKGPYHYKRWMILLQRWEPVVSNTFPSKIAFWIRIHGIPLHYWHEDTVMAIGKELGPIWDKDVDHGRVRVLIDGLENLEMRLPIELPSGDVIKVNLEYEKLEKHCFLCFSLRHEKESCPLNRDNNSVDMRNQGISQQNTLRKLEESRRRNDSRRSGTRSSKDRDADSREYQRNSQRSIQSRLQEPERRHYASQDKSRSFYSREEERRYSGGNRNGRERVQVRDHSSHHSFPSQRNHSPIRRASPNNRSQGERRTQNSGQRTQSSRTPPPRPPREEMDVPAAPDHNEVSSRARERISALARIEEGINQEEVRIPALDRIEIPGEEPPRITGLSSSLLARLQDVEVQYAENEHLSPIVEAGSGRGTLMNPNSGNLNSRVPATLRLGSGSGTKRKLNTSKPASNRPAQVKTLKKKSPSKHQRDYKNSWKKKPSARYKVYQTDDNKSGLCSSKKTMCRQERTHSTITF